MKITITKDAARALGVTDLMITVEEQEFLRESNAIERVYDKDSLDQAMYAWMYLREQKILTPSVVLKTHKILMLHQNLQPDEKGYFRQCEVQIGYRLGLGYRKVPGAMVRWCEGAALSLQLDISIFGSTEQVEEAIKQDHVAYEHIHPFIDGNGRTGRMFMNWQRRQKKLPLLIIHEGDEQYEYYKWFS